MGHHKFAKMSDSQKNEIISSIGGVAAGIAGAIGTASVAGVAGLSAAGITSGLAVIGGTLLAGLGGVVVAIPAAIGFGGYGLLKGIKAICDANELDCQDVDGRYEIVKNRPGTDLLGRTEKDNSHNSGHAREKSDVSISERQEDQMETTKGSKTNEE
jgi:hypothetical protein